MFSSEKKSGEFCPRSSEDISNGKSSYYVWFLGSKESRGLRGAEYIRPVVRQLLDRNADVKLTLQVSGKGLKIVQTPEKIKRRSISVPFSHNDSVKQFVPHSSITSVYQSSAPHDDVVSCILLLSTPGTDCPLFVHSYRCDSSETAALLTGQLQSLVDKPENLAKFDEIEAKLVDKGLLPGPSRDKFKRAGSSSSKIGSDGRSLGRSSDSGTSELSPSGPPTTVQSEKLVTLYDSLAAELREKLNSKGKHAPLLLPPRDYDTMHRSKGNLTQIEARKALNPAIVGETGINGSDHSSGIGSGGNSSPLRDSPPQMERFSSDDDWPELREHSDNEAKSHDIHEPLVSIQPYLERNHHDSPAKSSPIRSPPNLSDPKRSSQGGNTKLATVTRKNSFQEIQKKFISLERKQKQVGGKPIEEKLIKPSEIKQKSKMLSSNKGNAISSGIAPSSSLKEDDSAHWPKTDRDTGYNSRDKSRTRDFDSSPQESMKANKKLENYLSQHQEKYDHEESSHRAKVTRQASKCSGLMAPQFERSMEAVGEFEKVWSWADDPNNVPLTRELSPEFRRDKSPPRSRNRVLSPVEQRKSRARSPEFHKAARGMSSPAELRKVYNRDHHHHHHLSSEGQARGMAVPPHFQGHGFAGRRAMSPEVARRNSRSGLNSEPFRPVLRREKTSVFDNRYPSLDARSDKRKTLYELQEDVSRCDLRRRSYHELNNPELLLAQQPMPVSRGGGHNFQHSGKKMKESVMKKQYPQVVAAMPPPPHWNPHEMARGHFYSPHHMGPPPPQLHPHMMGRHGHPGPPPPGHSGRFAMGPMRHY